jgi:hypothetical protein
MKYKHVMEYEYDYEDYDGVRTVLRLNFEQVIIHVPRTLSIDEIVAAFDTALRNVTTISPAPAAAGAETEGG